MQLMEGLYAVHKKSTAKPCAAACRSAIRLRRVRRGGVVGTADSSRDGDGAASGVFAGGAADRSAGTGGAGKGGVTMLAAIAYRTEDGGFISAAPFEIKRPEEGEEKLAAFARWAAERYRKEAEEKKEERA